jgi:NADPH:quinone reductase-like Zn-dependent oxidoreductase
MKSVAVIGDGGERFPSLTICGSVFIEGVEVRLGLVDSLEPTFDPQSVAYSTSALVRILAFSCNYRDKGLIAHFARRCKGAAFRYFGSEFVGEVLAIGAGVKELAIGDRVIGNNEYIDSEPASAGGVPTNCASQRVQVLPQSKLQKVSASMSLPDAASFSIGSQTAYSMLRRLSLEGDTRVLVMSARSNTSLFCLDALRKTQAKILAASTEPMSNGLVTDYSLEACLSLDARTSRIGESDRQRYEGKIDVIIDPFFDLHLNDAIELLSFGGRYITCGLARQIGLDDSPAAELTRGLMLKVMLKNLSIIGNCLGTTADLTEALKDYDAGRHRVRIDSTFSAEDATAFVAHTFTSKKRLGKVVCQYGP